MVFFQDKSSGLKSIVAVHNTILGPALGGTRFWNYNSEAEAVNVTTLPAGIFASVVMLAGRVRVGAIVSCMVTVKLPLLVLPASSVDVQLTVVVPRANVEPDAGPQRTVGDRSRLSLEETI